jgi:hypothetical protein
MLARLKFVCLLAAILLFSGNAPQTSAEGAPQKSAPAAPAGTRDEIVTDPTMNNIKAFSVTIPSKWHFQGVLMQGDDCVGLPYIVWRASSPDGLSYVELMPALGWRWGSGPMAGFAEKQKNSCLPMKGPMHAQDFLKYLAATMKVEYVADEPVPAELNAKAQQQERDAEASVAGQYAARKAQPPKTTVELARAIVRHQNGSFTLKGMLGVAVTCTEATYPGVATVAPYSPGQSVHMNPGVPSVMDNCKAHVNYFTSPENQYVALIRQWEAPGMMGHGDIAWQNAWVARNQQQMQQRMDQFTAQNNRNFQAQQQVFAQQGAARQAQAQEFNHQQAVRQQMHNDFLSTMQRGTNMSMARTQENMNSRSTATSDWVDYALDRQTVLDPNTGQVNKVSSSYSYTWVDSTGKVGYQTNDVNANPNGVLQGTWTKQQVVHGNGTP